MFKWFLFENLFGLFLLLVGTQFLLICLWSWRRSDITRRVVWMGFAVMPALLIASHLIETTRERVMAFCERLARAVEEGDSPFIMRHFDAGFRFDEMDRDQVAPRLTGTLKRVRISDVTLRSFEVNIGGDGTATTEFRSTCRVHSEELSHDWAPLAWRLHLRPDGDTWTISRVESIPVPPLNLRDWRHLLRR